MYYKIYHTDSSAMFNLLRQFSRLAVCPSPSLQLNARSISSTAALNFKLTDQLCAEPMKKKKKVDPAIVKAREERRRKKLERQIRRLEKNARQLKPIEEAEIPFNLIDEQKKRTRPVTQLSPDALESRALLQKSWSQYKRKEYMNHVTQIDRIMSAQRRALNELKEESEELYDEAVMPDLALLPYRAKGPVATPPIQNYESPDGEYIDISKKWDN